jgi:hypothetical protein
MTFLTSLSTILNRINSGMASRRLSSFHLLLCAAASATITLSGNSGDEIVKLAEGITDGQKEEMHSLQNIEPYEIVNAMRNGFLLPIMK